MKKMYFVRAILGDARLITKQHPEALHPCIVQLLATLAVVRRVRCGVSFVWCV